MIERLITPPTSETTPTPEVDAAVEEIESTDEQAEDSSTVRALEGARQRVLELLESEPTSPDDAPTETLPAVAEADTTALPEVPPDDHEQQERRDTRTRLRKLGDSALGAMEGFGKNRFTAWLPKWLEGQGIIPVRGTLHKQKGMNFSAWVARRYVTAQEKRRRRLEPFGFLSAEAHSQINGTSRRNNPRESHRES